MKPIRDYEVVVEIKMTESHERIIKSYDKEDEGTITIECVQLPARMYILQTLLSDNTWFELARDVDIITLKNQMTFSSSLFPLD